MVKVIKKIAEIIASGQSKITLLFSKITIKIKKRIVKKISNNGKLLKNIFKQFQ